MGEGADLVNVTQDKALYIGGVAVLPNRHVLLFSQTNRSTKACPTHTTWTEYFPRESLRYANREQEELFEELERLGHFTFYHNDRIYIFGGGKGKSTGRYARDISNDIVMYDFHSQELTKHCYDKAVL